MKINQLTNISATTILVATLVSTHIQAQTSAPQAPAPAGLTGTLSASPAIVPVGVNARLTWKINYPSLVKKYVNIGGEKGSGDPGTITPTTNLYADVRVIGQGVTANTASGFTFVPTEATMSIGTSKFKRIFYGINPEINPGSIIDLKDIFSKTYTNNMIQAGKSIRFGGRYYYGDTVGTHYQSQSGDNVRFLVNGDTPPSNVPEYNAPSLESFLRPYLDTTGKVKIGPMDVIVFMELTHSSGQKSESGYDLQDMVLLVTFRKP
jgi:hypothetical protein